MCSQTTQTDSVVNKSTDSLESYSIACKKNTPVSDDRLQLEIETIFNTCKKQMQHKAELGAKIKHADWLRKGQTLEGAINEYFRGQAVHFPTLFLCLLNTTICSPDDMEVFEKAQALRLHFEHEKGQLMSNFNASSGLFNQKDTANQNAAFDYGDTQQSYSDYYPPTSSSSHSSSAACNDSKRPFDNYSSYGYDARSSKRSSDAEIHQARQSMGKKSRPFKSPRK